METNILISQLRKKILYATILIIRTAVYKWETFLKRKTAAQEKMKAF